MRQGNPCLIFLQEITTLPQNIESDAGCIPSTQHAYAYTGNNPINNIDPTGHEYDGNGYYIYPTEEEYQQIADELGIDTTDPNSAWKDEIDQIIIDGDYTPGGGSGDSGSGGGDSGGGGYTPPPQPTPAQKHANLNAAAKPVKTMLYTARPSSGEQKITVNRTNNDMSPKTNTYEKRGSQQGTSKTSWLNSTTPPIRIQIPSSGEIVSNILSSFTGSALGIASKIEKTAKIFENETGKIQLYPSASNVKVKPYKTAGKVGSVATIVANVLDIGNTWSKNNGNTNLKRIEKSAIQLGGTVGGLLVGAGTSSLVASGIIGAPATFGSSLGLFAVAGMVDYTGAKLIEKGQNFLYSKLGIR